MSNDFSAFVCDYTELLSEFMQPANRRKDMHIYVEKFGSNPIGNFCRFVVFG